MSGYKHGSWINDRHLQQKLEHGEILRTHKEGDVIMSVMIRGMKMPNSCSECDFVASPIIYNGKYICECPSVKSCGKNVTEAARKGIRDLDCPLVEVQKPHGRLIDADEICFCMTNGIDQGIAEEAIRESTTVIEAEDE